MTAADILLAVELAVLLGAAVCLVVCLHNVLQALPLKPPPEPDDRVAEHIAKTIVDSVNNILVEELTKRGLLSTKDCRNYKDSGPRP